MSAHLPVCLDLLRFYSHCVCSVFVCICINQCKAESSSISFSEEVLFVPPPPPPPLLLLSSSSSPPPPPPWRHIALLDINLFIWSCIQSMHTHVWAFEMTSCCVWQWCLKQPLTLEELLEIYDQFHVWPPEDNAYSVIPQSCAFSLPFPPHFKPHFKCKLQTT